MFTFPEHKTVNPVARKHEIISSYDILSKSKTVIKSFDTYEEAKDYCKTHRGTYTIRYYVKD